MQKQQQFGFNLSGLRLNFVHDGHFMNFAFKFGNRHNTRATIRLASKLKTINLQKKTIKVLNLLLLGQ